MISTHWTGRLNRTFTLFVQDTLNNSRSVPYAPPALREQLAAATTAILGAFSEIAEGYSHLGDVNRAEQTSGTTKRPNWVENCYFSKASTAYLTLPPPPRTARRET